MLLRTLDLLQILASGTSAARAAELTIGRAVEPDSDDLYARRFGGR